MTVSLFSILLIWGLVKLLRQKKLSQTIESFLTNRFTSQLIREEGMLGSLMNVWLLLSSVLCLGLLLSFFPAPFNLVIDQFVWFLSLSLILLVLTFIRFGVHSVLGSILNIPELSSEYIYNILLFLQALGLLVFPLLVAIAYTPLDHSQLLIIGLSVTAIFFVIRIIKFLYIGIINYRIQPFYIILYLCALEIAPILLAVKWLGLDSIIGS